MQRRSLARWLVVVALAAFGLGFLGSIASAQDGAEIAGQNAADDGFAQTGDATGSNTAGFNAGPSATASEEAASQQLGQNTAKVNQSGTGKSGDPVAGGQVTGSVGNATVQNQNNASGNTALSGNVDVANSADVTLGPFASSDFAEAQAQQTGDNGLEVNQAVTAESGDAVAGSQITGIANASEALVQNQNIADDNFAESGFAVADNFLDANLGPVAETFGPPAQAGQVGDNDAVIAQASSATSGDGVAGSQVTGAVGSSDFTVQNQNNSEANTGLSGFADAFNTAFAILGPSAVSLDFFGESAEAQAAQTGDNTVAADQASGASTGDALAGAQITGLVSSESGQLEVQNQQTSEDDFAQSGDATSDSFIDVEAGPQAIAFSGTEFGFSDFASFDEPIVAIVIDIEAVGGEAEAQASQVGDNAVDVTQAVDATTGDAVAGGQVTGAVSGDGSEITIQNQNSAEFSFAETGFAEADADAFVNAGPVADAATGLDIFADDSVLTCFPPDCTAETVDLLISLFVDVVGGSAEAQASQTGDNTVAVDQATSAESGDAVAGAQVTGVVTGDESDVTIQNQNSAEETEAISGDADADSDAFVQTGPLAEANDGVFLSVEDNFIAGDAACFTDFCTATAFGTLEVFADIEGGSAEAQASQIGDNATDVAQATSASTGDAVAGAQVTGSVAGDDSDTTIQNQNSSEFAAATTGDAFADNFADVFSGPLADAVVGVEMEVEDNAIDMEAFCAGAFCLAQAASTLVVDADVTGGDAEAQASQTGDNATTVDQAVTADTGDAVGGAQVTGAVTGDDSTVTIQNQNNSDFDFAESGDLFADNFVDVQSGPEAFADTGAEVEVEDNALDAAASCFGDFCLAFGTTSLSVVASVDGGDSEAQSSQIGDNATDVAQAVDAATGDAVAGAQVTGAVAGDDSEITVSVQNNADEPIADTGDAFVDQDAFVTSGPIADAFTGAFVEADDNSLETFVDCFGDFCIADAFSSLSVDVDVDGGDAEAQASQTGDNDTAVAQAMTAETGDAVSGAQVTGTVAGDDSEITIQGQNTSDLAEALSGDVFADNFADVESGPDADADTGTFVGVFFNTVIADADCTGDFCIADADAFLSATVDVVGGDAEAQASQIGDNTSSVDQAIDASTGDAVAGAQVTGAVAGSDSAITIQDQNNAEAPTAETGDVFADNSVDVFDGPRADAVTGADVFIAGNFVLADAASAGCDGDFCIADAFASIFINAFSDGGDVEAQASQTGDNDSSVAQAIDATTGDAVAGAQVTGAVAGDESEVTISDQNTSEDAFALSGDVFASNDADVNGGPDADAFTSAQISDFGFDNTAIAVAFCEGDFCIANAEAELIVFAEAIGGDAEAQAAQTGDNTADVAQSIDAETGDAVAGSQIAGVVAPDGDVIVQAQNNSEFSFAESGEVAADNFADLELGPQAETDVFVDVFVFGDALAFADCSGIPCVATDTSTVLVDLLFEDGTTEAQASQIGDNAATVAQDIDAATGDAVAGSQVVGIVGARDAETLIQNLDEFSEAFSGLLDVFNTVTGNLGPFADSPFGEAQAQHDGDSDGDSDQAFLAESGDALTGSQVTGDVLS